MALIKLGGLVTQISGKIGGQTLGTSSSGAYIKNSGRPRKAITLLQQTKMQRMATSSQAWRALSDAQRLVYINASSSYPYLNRVGETKYYSGFAIFTKLRNNLLNVNVTPTPSPLPLFTFPPLSNAVMTSVAGVYEITADGDDSNVSYRLFCSRPGSKGVTNSYKNQFFIVNVTADQLSSGYDISSALTAKFGAIAANNKIYWRLDGVNFSNGQVLKNMASGNVQATVA